ncbi:MAG TPA: glycosyltransferase family 39 protein [Candidatus Dormibacteraeota bacterium]|nr:glycosyltransferase family 39 protein [Candidatus Dormibacteraeota bacterium]
MKKRLRAAVQSLPLIVVFALGVRLLSLWHYISWHSKNALAVLPFLFESGNIAFSLLSGNGFGSPFRVYTGPTAWTTPIYPYLLAGIFQLFGAYTFAAFLAASLLNIVFVTLTTIPLYFAARKVGGPALGAAAAWLWVLFPNAILLTYESMWEECLATLLAALILWATFDLAENGSLRKWCVYGLLWGLELMTSPVLASTLPFLFAWLVYQAKRKGPARLSGKALAKPALALAIAILCCVPWTIRNYRIFHTLVPLRSTLGLQLWMGNNPQARPIWLGHLHPINNAAQQAEYVRMGEIAYMRRKMREALRYMLTHPRHEAQLIGRRFLAVWAGGTPYPLKNFLARRSLWFRYVLLFNLLAGIGAAAGIFALFRRRSPYALPLACFPVVYPWAYYLTLVEPRYGLPMEPMVLLLAAVALFRLAGRNF